MMQFLKTSSCSMLSSSLRAELLGGSREDVEGVVYQISFDSDDPFGRSVLTKSSLKDVVHKALG